MREGFDLDSGVLGADVGGEGVEFGGGAGDEEEVEGGAGEVEGEFFAEAVGGAGDDCPGGWGAEGTELTHTNQHIKLQDSG